MNHDITHCNGDGCPAKETCHRYKAYLDLLSKLSRVNETFGVCLSHISSADCIDNNFNMYWKEEDKTFIKYGEAIYIV